MKKKSIELTREQREQLKEVIRSGNAAARKIQHAQVFRSCNACGFPSLLESGNIARYPFRLTGLQLLPRRLDRDASGPNH
jgi:hypothetical protein